MRKSVLLFLVAWIAAMVGCAALLALWDPKVSILGWEPGHVIAHMLLFGVLAAALAAWSTGSGGSDSPPAPRSRMILAAAIFLLIPLAQEGAQLLPRGRPPGREEIFDISVDLAGGAVGLALWALAKRSSLRRRAHDRPDHRDT